MTLLENIYQDREAGKKRLAVLVDPDWFNSPDHVLDLALRLNEVRIDYLLYGGSLITKPKSFDSLSILKKATEIPIILFPSGPGQIRSEADAILFLSLISGRNPEYLIGHHVVAAPILSKMDLEVLPVGYMIVGSGKTTTAEYVSNTAPLPYHKPEIAAATAMAGEMLGLKLIYMDGGSGAEKPISKEMIEQVRSCTKIPLIVGGGIKSKDQAISAFESGADIVVVGSAVEKNLELLSDLIMSKSFGS